MDIEDSGSDVHRGDDRGVVRRHGHPAPDRHAHRGEPSTTHAGSTLGENELAGALSELARHLQHLATTDQVLDEIVAAAIGLIPGAEQGSIADVQDHGRRIVHRAASSDLPKRVDALMQEVGQGPCLDAVWEQRTIRVDDLGHDHRWPLFSQRAADLGARSMLSFQLFVEHHNLGALNLYSGRPGAFTDESENVGLMLATHVAVAYASIQNATNLRIALDSRTAIGQAIGIIMERYHLGLDRAFNVLIRFSQQTNRKLAEIATQVVQDTHAGHRDLPTGLTGPDPSGKALQPSSNPNSDLKPEPDTDDPND